MDTGYIEFHIVASNLTIQQLEKSRYLESTESDF
jgi:hypothetical protein